MIKYGIKLWTNNSRLFPNAADGYKNNFFDFVELYHNADEIIDFDELEILKRIPIIVHNTNNLGFHEFEIRAKQLDIWEKTKKLADYFGSSYIVVHPGGLSSFNEFQKNLEKIDDPRILIENMAGLDLNGNLTFGYDLLQLEKIKQLKEICFDFEKAVKAACYQEIDYKEFVADSLKNLKPFYFHISGGNKESCQDEHGNLWESNFDLKWIKKILLKISHKKDVFLVFETPKGKDGMKNDIKNIKYFKEIK